MAPLTIRWHFMYNVLPWLPWALVAALAALRANRGRALWLLLALPAAWVLSPIIDTRSYSLMRELGAPPLFPAEMVANSWLIVLPLFLLSDTLANLRRRYAIPLALMVMAIGVIGIHTSFTGWVYPEFWSAEVHKLIMLGALLGFLQIAAFAAAISSSRRRFSTARFLAHYFACSTLLMIFFAAFTMGMDRVVSQTGRTLWLAVRDVFGDFTQHAMNLLVILAAVVLLWAFLRQIKRGRKVLDAGRAIAPGAVAIAIAFFIQGATDRLHSGFFGQETYLYIFKGYLCMVLMAHAAFAPFWGMAAWNGEYRRRLENGAKNRNGDEPSRSSPQSLNQTVSGTTNSPR